jgi:uncharacterized protein
MKNDIYIIRNRWWFIALPVILSLLMLIPLRSAKINPDLMEYLPDNISAKINIDKLESHFGKNDPFLILFETDDVLGTKTLERIQNLNNAFSHISEIEKVISLFEMKYIRGDEGNMLVDPVIRKMPSSELMREQLRNEIKDNKFVYKLLVSSDFRYTIMLLNPVEGISDEELYTIISKQLEEFGGNEKVYLSGLPYLRYEIQRTAIRDLAILMPVGLLVMLFFLYFSFKEKKGVLLPLSVVVMSIIVSMGLMPLLGYELSLIAVLVPIMMIAIANNYGVHLMARYQELNAQNPRWGMKRIINESVRKLYMPIILTALTTIVGILGLAAHIMLPAKQMGIVSAVGILFALVVSLLFIPAVMAGIHKGDTIKTDISRQNGWLNHLLTFIGKIVIQKPKLVILSFIVLMVLASIGLTKVQVSINLDEMMPPKHSLRQSTAILNRDFGGTKTISILFEGDIKSPEVMQEMDNLESRLKKIPEVGSVTSLASIIRTISKAMNNPGDAFYDRIPDQRDAIAQYIEFYSMSGDPDDFNQMVDFDYTKAIVNVQFKAKDYSSFIEIEKKIGLLVEQAPHCTLMAGQCLVEKELSRSIVLGQIYSLLFALGAIILLLWLIFRSFRAGLTGAIPLIVTLLCNFGLMGWVGLQLDIATSLLSSIAIGIGVDYTIHLFWRIKQELQKNTDWDQAIATTLKTTGRGIAINAFSVMLGFSVLFFSGLTILKAFGFLIIFSLLLCLLCALVLIPALFKVFQPNFLNNNKNTSI